MTIEQINTMRQAEALVLDVHGNIVATRAKFNELLDAAEAWALYGRLLRERNLPTDPALFLMRNFHLLSTTGIGAYPTPQAAVLAALKETKP
jgi:hypothetical protein